MIRPLRLLLLVFFLFGHTAATDQARLIKTDREAAEARVEMVLEAQDPCS